MSSVPSGLLLWTNDDNDNKTRLRRRPEGYQVTTANTSPQALTSSSPLIQEVHDKDLDEQGTSEQGTPTVDGACLVCAQHVARYTCPRCNLPYCSVACYRRHNDNTSNEGNNNAHSQCTERFYQERVQQVVELERQDQHQETCNILNRVHRQQQQSLLTTSETPLLSQSELMDLLRLLETQSLSEEELLQQLQRNPQMARALEQGLLQQQSATTDWLLEPWYPWWRQELSTNDTNDQESEIDVGTEDQLVESTLEMNAETALATVDERLSQIPPFAKLVPKRTDPPLLHFNLVDLLYATVWMLRLYHGLTNAMDTAIAAVCSLCDASAVLSNDARYTTIHEALAESVARSAKALQHEECNTRWNVLVQDVVLVCRGGHRLIGRALLEAMDVVNAGIQATKAANDKDGATELRKIRKKLEFYISWSREEWLSPKELAVSIQEWASDWKLNNTDELERDADFLLPS